MWEARFLRFPRTKGNPRFCLSGIFLRPSFPRPVRRPLQLLEESALGLLHALRGFGVAVGGGDAL